MIHSSPLHRRQSQEYMANRISNLYSIASSSFNQHRSNSMMSSSGNGLYQSASVSSLSRADSTIRPSNSCSINQLQTSSNNIPISGNMTSAPRVPPQIQGQPQSSTRAFTSLSESSNSKVNEPTNYRPPNVLSFANDRVRIGSQQSDDSTLRYCSQASEISHSQNQHQNTLLLLRDSERATRIEAKLDDIVDSQKKTFEQLESLSEVFQKQQNLLEKLTAINSHKQDSLGELIAPQTQSLNSTTPIHLHACHHDSEDEDEFLFSNDWPVSAEDMFAKARKAREIKLRKSATAAPSASYKKQMMTSNKVEATRSMAKESKRQSFHHRPLYIWDGRLVTPPDGPLVPKLLDMVNYLSKEMGLPRSDFVGLNMRETTNKRLRFASPVGEGFFEKSSKAIDAFAHLRL